jgi:hypothetical protein
MDLMEKFFRKIIPTLLLFSLVICLASIAIETRTKIARRFYDNLLMDNWNHYLPCEELPAESEVNAIIQQHQDIILIIEQVHPGLVGVDVDTSICPGKADVMIWYASHQDRLEIEAILAGETFFGVPIRLQNR